MSIEHPHIIAGPLRTAKDGQCIWIWHYSGVWLHCCEELAVPGDPWLCPDHLIEWQEHPDRPGRVFPSVAVPSDVPPAFSKEQADA